VGKDSVHIASTVLWKLNGIQLDAVSRDASQVCITDWAVIMR